MTNKTGEGAKTYAAHVQAMDVLVAWARMGLIAEALAKVDFMPAEPVMEKECVTLMDMGQYFWFL